MEDNKIIEIKLEELILKYPNYYDLGEAVTKLFEKHKDNLKFFL